MQKFANPTVFLKLANAVLPYLWVLTAALFALGLYGAFVTSPADYQQGETVRIMYIHVPAAWIAIYAYGLMAIASAIAIIFRHPLADAAAKTAAPLGAVFCLLGLATGSIWGKPTWGTWWVWDARLTSEFILLLMYGGYIALTEAIDDPKRAANAGALLALVGVVNVPIIYFSVRWWNTLHQGSSINLGAAPKMAATMLTAMLLMTVCFWAYSFAVVFTRARAVVLEQESDTDWVRAIARPEGKL